MTISDDEPDRLDRLERQMQEISGRLAALEGGADPVGVRGTPPRVARPASMSPPSPRGGALPGGALPGSALPGGALPAPGSLPAPEPWPGPPAEEDGPGGEPASFAYSGQGRFGRHRMVMHQRARLSEIMEAEPELVAKVFGALASPARIVLLRALLDGPRTSQQLRAELDDPSVGQLYHHLRELLAAGLIVQPGRSLYALPRGGEIALCIEILAAMNLALVGHPYPATPPGPLDEDTPAPAAGAAGDTEPTARPDHEPDGGDDQG